MENKLKILKEKLKDKNLQNNKKEEIIKDFAKNNPDIIYDILKKWLKE
jgi:flagellar biosynthesis/type III secretory pathway M-ring protein FliF/YscJ